MAILSRNQVHRIELDYEPGEWVEIRPLAWSHLKAARAAQRGESADFLKRLEGAPVNIKRDDDDDDGGDVAVRTRQKQRDMDRARGEYDQGIILEHGITGWSYDDEVTTDNIAELDPTTADLLFELLVMQSSIGFAQGKGSEHN